MSLNSQKHKAMLQMLLCGLMWSTAGVFIKLIPWNPFAIAGARSLVAGLITLVYMRAAKIKFRLTAQAFLGGLFMCLTFFAFTTANKYTSAANAIALQYTQPVFIMLFSVLFMKQKFRLGDLAAALGTIGGISLFFLDKFEPGYWLGNLLGLLAGMFIAIMFLIVGNSPRLEERLSATFTGHLLTAAVGLPFLLSTPTPLQAVPLLSVLALGVFQVGISYILMVKAFAHCPPLACSLLGAIEPILNPVWVFLITGEAPGSRALLGGLVVVATITIWCIWRDNSVDAPSAARI